VELKLLIPALSDPRLYSGPVEMVEVRQTHSSVVFLAGNRVYKIKKPVNLGFLDFSTLDKRRHDCEEEVRLNRRLAPRVYRRVVGIRRDGDSLRLGGNGDVVEWAVEMERLPDEATLLARLQHNAVEPGQIEELARRIADFHRGADRGPHIAACGRFEVVAGNTMDNFLQSRVQIGTTIDADDFATLVRLTETALANYHTLIESRADHGIPCDTHGDLHLDHVYLFPEQTPPDDIVIIDCIEFTERYRYADPVADVAFLVMDLLFHGRADLAQVLKCMYFWWDRDVDGETLLPFYTAYRACVRAKVEGMKALESEVHEAERAEAVRRSRGHWKLALEVLRGEVRV
jgi:uncharacterized protein